ncbi:tetratricopeptide repeat-containing sulfotransferase family protein [Thiohalorhabdus sp. Cl-TMA]|uniref:Sulfotransferase n=1 Tax=Thiohalorhabdus methylotrophus TaxID=3242694 RepID=A0ABV4TY41_9GAMM
MTEADAGNGNAQDARIAELLDTAHLHHKGGDLERAEDLYREILQNDAGVAGAHHGMGLIALQVGQPRLAVEFFRTAIELKDDPLYHCNLATAHFSLEDLASAEAEYRKAIEAAPSYGEAYLNLGLTLKAEGRHQEACDVLDRAVVLRPRDPQAFAKLAEVLLLLDRHDEAKEIARAAANLGPRGTEARETVAKVLRSLSLPKEAMLISRQLVNEFPAEAKYRIQLAGDYQSMGFSQAARPEAQRAVNLEPDNPRGYGALAHSLAAGGDWDGAEEQIDKALELAPDDEFLIAQKGNLLERKGSFKEAYKLVRPLIVKGGEYKPAIFNLFLTLTRRFDAQEEAIGMLENALNNQGLPNGVRLELNFQAGHMYADLGRYDESFAAYARANALKPRVYHRDREEENFRNLMEGFSAELFRQAPRSTLGSRRPVFIVGMPRSGTSLTEQILASHPDVFGAGELSEVDRILNQLTNRSGGKYPGFLAEVEAGELDWGAQEYLNHINTLAPEGVERVTDKMPQNFLHLGLIALLFPEAKIIHTNRDPLDNCLSCYVQNFAAAGMSFTYSLENLGHYHRLYQQLMEHWRQVLPMPIYELQYEELVENPEGEIPRLLDFVELPFDQACLEPHKTKRDTKTASYDQVRQPIYRKSKQRWRKYEKHLGPLMEALGMDAGELDDA